MLRAAGNDRDLRTGFAVVSGIVAEQKHCDLRLQHLEANLAIEKST